MRAKQPRVIVFTTPTCTYCKAVKRYLREHKIKFKDVDISRDERAARDVMRRTGQMGVPVIDVGGRLVIGFDRAKLDRLLGLRG